jgi:hypothetical protein
MSETNYIKLFQLCIDMGTEVKYHNKLLTDMVGQKLCTSRIFLPIAFVLE